MTRSAALLSMAVPAVGLLVAAGSRQVVAGVRGTPSFFIGKGQTDGTVQGLLISGARPLADFRQEIERVLAEK